MSIRTSCCTRASHPGCQMKGERTPASWSCSIFGGPLFELCVELALALTAFVRMNTACAQTHSSPEVVQMGRYVHAECQVQHPIRVLRDGKRTCFTEGHRKHACLSSPTPTHTPKHLPQDQSGNIGEVESASVCSVSLPSSSWMFMSSRLG